jgi:transcriptional regulator with XRE-family HTH domain
MVPISGLMRSLLAGYAVGFHRRHKRRGYDLEWIAARVAEICGIGEREFFSGGCQKEKVKARGILSYWAGREAGIPLRALARRLGISAPGVGMLRNGERSLSVRTIMY